MTKTTNKTTKKKSSFKQELLEDFKKSKPEKVSGWYSKKFNNFAEYLSNWEKHSYGVKKELIGQPKCIVCNGSGRVVAPWEQSDPVEGYKMADRIPCVYCNATGVADMRIIKEEYKKANDDYNKRYEKWKHEYEILKATLSKLTDEEARLVNYA